jgi:hypothetical protein
MDRQFIVPEKLVLQISKYISSCPLAQVVGIYEGLKELKEFKEVKTEETKG